MRVRRAGAWTLGAAVALAAAVLAAAGVMLLTAGDAPAGGGLRDRLVGAAGETESDAAVREALEAVRAGRTKHAVALLREVQADGPPELRARLANLLGVLVLLGGGDNRAQAEAQRHFERAIRTGGLEDAKFNLELLLSQESRRGKQPPAGGKRARSAVRQGGAGRSGAGY